jgi:hypothetical protein
MNCLGPDRASGFTSRFVNGEPRERTGEYDTVEEALKHHWRLDWDQRVRVGHKKYLTRTQFEDWAKARGERS